MSRDNLEVMASGGRSWSQSLTDLHSIRNLTNVPKYFALGSGAILGSAYAVQTIVNIDNPEGPIIFTGQIFTLCGLAMHYVQRYAAK